MNRCEFKLIAGGLAAAKEKEYKYISGYATDTRLMGVVCMYIHWYIPDDDEDFHQFFYFECEERGFEDYKSVRGNDAVGISIIESKLTGGLGGNKTDISRLEAEALLCEYVHFNRTRGYSLPGDSAEYEFMLRADNEISGEEKEKLFVRLCGSVENRYQAINYFLMKTFAHDYKAARYLCSGRVDLHVFDGFKKVTFCKNTIDPTDAPDVYMCESIISDVRGYYLVTSEITMDKNRIAGIRQCSSMRLSYPETRMIMSKSEYITVYDIVSDCTIVDDLMKRNVITADVHDHPGGNCYIVYNRDNDHVKRRVFWLNEDVYGIYFVSAYNQLIACAYHEEFIQQMEIELALSEMGEHIDMTARYEFKESVIYDYIQGDYVDFEEFIDYICRKDDE